MVDSQYPMFACWDAAGYEPFIEIILQLPSWIRARAAISPIILQRRKRWKYCATFLTILQHSSSNPSIWSTLILTWQLGHQRFSAIPLQWPCLHPSHRSLLCGPSLWSEKGGASICIPHHFCIRYATLSLYEWSNFGLLILPQFLQDWWYILALYWSSEYLRIVMAIFLLVQPGTGQRWLRQTNRPMILVSYSSTQLSSSSSL